MFSYAGMTVRVIDAQKQCRTARDVRGPWIRPKVPSKAAGRKGTRRAFKRCNVPHFVMLYREPTDAIMIGNHTVILTPTQMDWVRKSTIERVWDTRPGDVFGLPR